MLATPNVRGGNTVSDTDLEEVLRRTRPLWDELRGGRVFLTGGTGFFGCWLLQSFLYANQKLGLQAEAVVLTRDPGAFCRRAPWLTQAPAIHLHQGDVSNFDFPDGEFTHLIHAASELSVAQPRDPVGLIETTIRGTRRVLELARQRGVKKLLFTSSGAVYGPPTPGRGAIREDALISALPLEPKGAYAEAKRLAELVCVIFGREHGIEIKIARGFAFIGPYLPLDSHLAAANFLRAALQGEEIVIQGHGRTVRSYLYGADLAVWLWTILFSGQSGRPYNVGSDSPITIAEFAAAIASACDPVVPVRILGRLEPNEPIDVYLPDLSRARAELGLDVYTPIARSIQASFQSARENRDLATGCPA